MSTLVDMALVAKDGSPILLVEVKGRSPSTSAWASQLRRNLLAHAHLPRDSWFLLASPDRFYLWKPQASPTELVPPDFEADAREILRPYLVQLGEASRNLSEESWELLVWAWLSELLKSPTAPDEEFLRSSGLLDELRGTRLQQEYSP